MTSYPLSEIAGIIKGEIVPAANFEDNNIRFLSFDSRTLLSGKETLFFALKNNRNDGHNYISDACDKGVRAFVVDRIPANISPQEESTYILVEDTLIALQQLAAFHRKSFSYPVLAITGSNGKTIVKEWLAEILGHHLQVVRSPRSYNSQIGNPLSVWLMDEHHDLAIFEAGISQPGEMDRLEKILCPTHGIFTHLGNAHLENFESTHELINEKIKLFLNSELIVYCIDFKLLHQSIDLEKFSKNPEFFRWSEYETADLQITKKEKGLESTDLKALFKGQEIALQISFTDDAHIENAIHCWAYLLAAGYPPGSFERYFLNLSTVSMRLELRKGIHGCTIIDDSYNSDTASLINALDFLHQQNDAKKLRSTVILSDILQSGKNPEQLYQEVAGYIQLRKVDRVIGIGPEILKNKHLFEAREKSFFPSTEEYLIHFNEKDYQADIILLKGARDFRFDRISSLLQQKKHQTVMEINLSAMVHNLNYFRHILAPSTKVMAMVKAFSYGTGSVEVARILQFRRVDYLAVAIADEGIELRNNGITLPIVVMNPEEHSFNAMIEYQLEPNIYRYSLLQSFDEALRKSAVTAFPVHIKLDTGMKRLGFDQPSEISKVVSFIRERNTMYIRSVFSHLSASEDPKMDNFTRKQFALFEEYSQLITKGFSYKILLHLLNTAGIERFPEMQLDMVRLGIGLYGVSGTGFSPLRNVASLKTNISQIKTVFPGDTVGYGRRYEAREDAKIAVIPIGYADGFSRRLGNGVGSVIINGQNCPVVGSVCMDMSMVNVTGVDCKEDDPVLIFGADQSVSQIAEWMGTISYEVLTTVGQRVKRIYFEE